MFRVSGHGASETFGNEAGGHRWQRVPPTERRGRVHTSTVTVAVLPEPTDIEVTLRPQDLEITACRGSGAGGQHRNVTDSAIQVRHKPTGLIAKCESERSQHRNKANAIAVLRARVWEHMKATADRQRGRDRRVQIGSGMRGDKRRTIRCQDGHVRDHITGQSWNYEKYIAGLW